MRCVALSTLWLLALGGYACAQAIDAAGADRLSADLRRYVGETAFAKGIVAVAPDGDAYALTVNLNVFASMLPAGSDAKLAFDDYRLRLKPLPGGTWNVAAPLFPSGSAAFNGPNGRQTLEWAVAGGSFEGVYDPALAAFTTASGRHGLINLAVDDGQQTGDVTIQSGTFAMTGTATASGGVDIAMRQDQQAFAQTMAGREPSGKPIDVDVRADRIGVETTAKNLNARRLLDLNAFLVANADEARIKANQTELKRLLLAALPVWDRLDGGQVFENFRVETPIGPVGARAFGLDFSMTGITDDGAVRYGFSITDPVLPEGLLPPWAIALMPTVTDLNFAGANLDLAMATRRAIDAFDLNRDPPLDPAIGDEIAAAFLSKGPKVVIEPSTIRNAATAFTFRGEVTGFTGASPTVDLTVEVSGYDVLVSALTSAAATDPIARQAQPAALAAQAFAKQLPDGRLQWAFEAKADGSVRVNGSMLKPADSPAPPIAPGLPGTLQQRQ